MGRILNTVSVSPNTGLFWLLVDVGDSDPQPHRTSVLIKKHWPGFKETSCILRADVPVSRWPLHLACWSQPLNFYSCDSLLTGDVMSTNVVFSISFLKNGTKTLEGGGQEIEGVTGGSLSYSSVPAPSEI